MGKHDLFRFGRTIPGLTIDGKPAPYPVLDEREARAGAGIMLALAAVAFAQAFLLQEYLLIDIVVILFVVEFGLRIVDPHIAPLYALGRFAVRGMRPEYTGAAQKRFAWTLGLLMAGTVATLIYGFGIRGAPNAILCGICLVLMWMETAFGHCVGCKMYYGLMRAGIIKEPEHKPACPGGACPLPVKRVARSRQRVILLKNR